MIAKLMDREDLNEADTKRLTEFFFREEEKPRKRRVILEKGMGDSPSDNIEKWRQHICNGPLADSKGKKVAEKKVKGEKTTEQRMFEVCDETETKFEAGGGTQGLSLQQRKRKRSGSFKGRGRGRP